MRDLLLSLPAWLLLVFFAIGFLSTLVTFVIVAWSLLAARREDLLDDLWGEFYGARR